MLLELAVVQVGEIYLFFGKWFAVVVHTNHLAFKIEGHAHEIVVSMTA